MGVFAVKRQAVEVALSGLIRVLEKRALGDLLTTGLTAQALMDGVKLGIKKKNMAQAEFICWVQEAFGFTSIGEKFIMKFQTSKNERENHVRKQ